MKIVIAPDSFKGSLTAREACMAMETGVRRVLSTVEIINLPMADGGEGTVDALISSTSGQLIQQKVKDPLGNTISATYGILGDGVTAVIEMAAASGLPLVPAGKRDPLNTTTFGTGELIRAAFYQGCRKFIIGIGGSATNDCGTGMAQALGVHFFDKSDRLINQPMVGGLLGQVTKIDLSGLIPGIQESDFIVACDVDNPLLGPRGCAAVYSPQKGATPEIVARLEQNMTGFIDILEKTVGFSVRNNAGAGAAGGLGAGLMAFLKAKLTSGIKIVLEASRFAEKIHGADLILTGEGKIDFQTAFGKTLSGVATEAKKQAIPVIAIGGSVDLNIENLHEIGINSFFSICNQPMDLSLAMKEGGKLLDITTERVLRAILSMKTS
ncbi:glycerate kinase [candidate division KSB1 bacterium]|nr:glycerate kinase [candidate division KSB1 bacterium]